MAARVGHDLVLDVTRWSATVDLDEPRIELDADSRSLEVREGLGGIKPLTDQDRSDILENIDEKVLLEQPISFRSSAVRLAHGEGRIDLEGDLTIAGSTRPISARLSVGADGHVGATIRLAQSAWGIKPYRGLMGALKVRDELQIVIDAHLPVK